MAAGKRKPAAPVATSDPKATKGPGRPPAKVKRQRMAIVLTPDTRQKLREMAFHREAEYSEIVEEAILVLWKQRSK